MEERIELNQQNLYFHLDFREFVLCLSITTRGTEKEQIKWIFRLYDIDGDGFIEIEEILEVLKSANLEERYTAKIVELFDQMDLNKDGVLSKEEFISQSMTDNTSVRILGTRGGSNDMYSSKQMKK